MRIAALHVRWICDFCSDEGFLEGPEEIPSPGGWQRRSPHNPGDPTE